MIAAIIQARMGAIRLPGKVLKKVNGLTLLEYQIDRVRKAMLIDEIIVATSVNPADDPISALCGEIKIKCFRGPENDVLTRYYECAKNFNVDIIARLTADCPLNDPFIIDKTIKLYKDAEVDFAANTIPPETSRYPDGFDVEVFNMQVLEKAFKEVADLHDREHVTFYFWKYGRNFKTAQLSHERDFSKYRFTVDYPEDFEVVKFVIQELKKRGLFGHMEEIINIIDSNIGLKAKNSKYYPGIGWKI